MAQLMDHSHCSEQQQSHTSTRQLPDAVVEQLMSLSQSLYRDTAGVFATLQDWGLHSNHLFPDATRYAPHHCPACGLIERATQTLSCHHKLVDTCVRRLLLDRTRDAHNLAAVRLYAWVAVQYSKELGLVHDAREQEAYATRLLHALVPERFVDGQGADELTERWEESPLLFPLDEMMEACVRAFTAAYAALALAYEKWRESHSDLCPALFVETESSRSYEPCAR